jgi:hypothetical protein
VHAAQQAVWSELGVDSSAQALVFGGNFQRIFAN